MDVVFPPKAPSWRAGTQDDEPTSGPGCARIQNPAFSLHCRPGWPSRDQYLHPSVKDV